MDVDGTLDRLKLDYRLRLAVGAPTSVSRAISAVGELLVRFFILCAVKWGGYCQVFERTLSIRILSYQ